MNKQEAIDSINNKIKKLQAEVNKLKTEPDTSELVFKPKRDEKLHYVNRNGNTKYMLPCWDDGLSSIGNCFRNEEDAKNSAKYYIMNSDYDYWFPWSGQPKPKVLPKGLEFYSSVGMEWRSSHLTNIEDMEYDYIYRWKRSEQGR